MAIMSNEQELRDLVVQLRADKENLTQELAAVGTMNSTATPNDHSTPAVHPDTPAVVPDRLLYAPRERKCPIFRGTTGIGIVEWVEEVRASMRARRLAPVDQAYFIYDHLERPAKDEIKYRPKEDREDPERVLSILQEVYACGMSYVALQKDFFSRKQLDGESLQEYSHALFELMEKIMRNSPQAMPNSSVLLRDQFVEHVNDPDLRRALKQFVRAKPTATLLDVRGEAIRWEREGILPEGRPRSFSVPSICATHTSRVFNKPDVPPQNELADIKEMLRKQQEQLNQFSDQLRQLQNPPRWPQSQNNGPIICRRCQRPGHYARDCDNERVPSQAPRPQYRPGQQSNPTKNPSEN